VTEKKLRILTEETLQPLLNSSDEFLVELGKEYLERDEIPDSDEASNMLGFFLNFSVGCAKLGCDELRARFNRRADKYILVLINMGYQSGWKTVAKWTRIRSPLDVIIMRACSHVKLYMY